MDAQAGHARCGVQSRTDADSPDASRRKGKLGGRPKGKSAQTLAKKRGKTKALAELEITAATTMRELGRQAFLNRTKVFKDGKLKPFEEWTEDEQALCEGWG